MLGEIYAGALTAKKFDVTKKLNIGARAAVFSALERGDLTVLPEYTGSLLGYVSKGKGTGKDAAEQVNQLKSSLPRQADAARAVGRRRTRTRSPATRRPSSKFNLKSIEDLKSSGPQIVMGGARRSSRAVTASGSRGSSRAYGVDVQGVQAARRRRAASVAALKDNKVNCANLFSTQSAIPANGFVTLEDPKHLAQTEAVVPLIAKSAATPEVSQVLNDVSSKLTTDNLVEMVKRVEVDKDDASTVADDFLSKNGLK